MNTKSYKQRLLAKEQELEGEIARLKTDAVESRTAEVEDPMDYVTSSTGQTMAREISSMESDTLTAVRDALRRIEEGAYGTCLDCGEQIEEARLDAVPWTAYCLRDQEKHDNAEATSGRDYLEAAL
ncbi:MAG: TraR/DksA C4-type zinc finger protein [Acidobacteriota bacterium]|nr:TraR/DksA C4-type zinc finger protein [Acidobacteriota bacterium]